VLVPAQARNYRAGLVLVSGQKFVLWAGPWASCHMAIYTLSQTLRLNLRLGGYSIWSAILQSHFHISFGFKTTRAFLKTFKGSTRGRLGLLEKTSKIAQISAGVHSSLGMLRLLLRTFDL
jgi:hypothetical protein